MGEKQIDELKMFDFEKFGAFKFNSVLEKITFEPIHNNVETEIIPKVYVWIYFYKTCMEIIYVGKTRYTIESRMTQHRQGFKGKLKNGSTSGSKKFLKLKDILSRQEHVEVWARKSEIRNLEIKGEMYHSLSHFSVEEEFFINLYKPLLNINN
jgi:hypothetical protein